jgi:flagellar FliJ protein
VSALDTILRVHRWQLDERRSQLAELERLEARLNGEMQRLLQEVDAEQRVATASLEAGLAYSSYAAAIRDRQAKLNASLAEVGGQMAQAREALAEAFQEVKRYETAAANRLRQQKAAANRRQQIAQDEMALQIHRRRQAP